MNSRMFSIGIYNVWVLFEPMFEIFGIFGV